MTDADELKEALDTLWQVVNEICWSTHWPKGADWGKPVLSSYGNAAYADALRLLERHGYVEIVEEHGNYIHAKPVTKS